MSLLAFALLIVSNLTGAVPTGDHRAIAESVARQCNDEACASDALTWGWDESRLQRHPHPYSTDAANGTSCGVFQTPCAQTPQSVDGQVRLWLNLRRQSLFACGDLSALASGKCSYATALVESRAREAEW